MSTQLKPQYSNLGFDPDACAKYRQERDKRVRPEGNDQYVEVTGKFAHFVDDPYVEPGFTRDPLCDEIDIVIIGGALAACWRVRGFARRV
jgi:cyclohexanone monooxygenase